MSDSETEENGKPEGIMKLVDTYAYIIPDQVLELKINRGLRNFFPRIFSSEEKDEEYQPFDTLNAFSTTQIEKIVPKPDWFQAHEYLDYFLDVEMAQEDPQKFVFINKPNSGTKSIVEAYIEDHDYSIQQEPGYDKIMQYSEGDPIELEMDKNIAILNLENWFLQYFPGLEFIEKLMQKIDAHEHSVILVCNSWTWRFITTVLKIPTSNYTIKMFQSLSHKDLENWLVNLSINLKKRKLLYRKADSGKLVSELQLPLVKEIEETVSKDGNTLAKEIFKVDSNYMKKLAGYSMGLPLTCWHIWRHSLRRHRDESLEVDNPDQKELNPYTIWVLPWKQISLPKVPKSLTTDEKMLLFAIILHNGLPLNILEIILDIESYHLIDHIERLSRAGIIYRSQNHYYVSSNIYPKIRKILGNTGFIIDDLEVF